jgi:hypothetical protein
VTRTASIVVAAVALAAIAGAVALWSRSRPSSPSTTAGAAGAGPARPDGDSSSGAAARPDAAAPDASLSRDAAVAADAADAPAAPAPPDLLAIVAGWVARLDPCPLAQARSPNARGYVRFDVSEDHEPMGARLVDVAADVDVADDCFHSVFGERRDVADASRSQLAVWWPIGRAAVRDDRGTDAAVHPTPPEQLGVDMLVVPSAYPSDGLPAGVTTSPWLGLCGPKTIRALPGTVLLDVKPDDENKDFDDVSVVGCGPKPDLVPVIRGPGLDPDAEATLATVRAKHDSPVDEVAVRLGGDRYRLWQIRSGLPHGILALRDGTTVQVLATDEDPEWSYAVIWAGDLDHDGRLDLIIRDNEPDEGRYRLFLSHAQRVLPTLFAAEVQLPGD